LLSRERTAAAEQFAEKVALQSEEQPQRLKPIDFVALTARLEAAPFQNKTKAGVFQQTVKPRPFKTKSKPEVFSMPTLMLRDLCAPFGALRLLRAGLRTERRALPGLETKAFWVRCCMQKGHIV